LKAVAKHFPQGDPEGPDVRGGGELQEGDALGRAPGKQIRSILQLVKVT